MTSPLKDRADRIRKKDQGTTASVTRRLDGEAGYAADNRAANLARRSLVAAKGGHKGRAKRLKGRAENRDDRAMSKLSPAEQAQKRKELREHNIKLKAKQQSKNNPTTKASF